MDRYTQSASNHPYSHGRRHRGSILAWLALPLAACGGADDSGGVAPEPLGAPSAQTPATANPTGAAAQYGKVTIDGITHNYVVEHGYAVTGGDMVLGRVDAEGKLIASGSAASKKGAASGAKKGASSGESSSDLIGRGFDRNLGNIEWPSWKWAKDDYGSWGQGGCRVPFVINEMPIEFANAIRDAANWFTDHTWCRWEETLNDEQKVQFIYDTGIDGAGKSPVGRLCDSNDDGSFNCNRADQWIRINENTQRVIRHEMMHSLGFYHEHQRPNRDQYVDIASGLDPNWVATNIAIYQGDLDHFSYGSTGYDLYSIMHYQGHCSWYGLFCGVWTCFGDVLPKGYGNMGGTVECADYWEGYTVSVGGEDLNSNDRNALYVMYPPPPNRPLPPPAPPDTCEHRLPAAACAKLDDPPECCYPEPLPNASAKEEGPSAATHAQPISAARSPKPARAWSPQKDYRAGDEVWAGTRWFHAVASHEAGASTSPVEDAAHWRGNYVAGRYWRGNIDYPKNAVVEYEEDKYVARRAHLSLRGEGPAAHPELWLRMSR